MMRPDGHTAQQCNIGLEGVGMLVGDAIGLVMEDGGGPDTGLGGGEYVGRHWARGEGSPLVGVESCWWEGEDGAARAGGLSGWAT